MKTAIIIGRFQPITKAHTNIIQNAIDYYDETYVVVINSKPSIVGNVGRRLRASGSITTIEQDVENWKLKRKDGRIPKSYSSKKLQGEKERNPFSGMARKKLVYKAFKGKLNRTHIISHTHANVQQIINKIQNISGNTDFVILCGSDREKTYQPQIDDAFKKGFFVPEVESVTVELISRNMSAIDNVSATRVRDALRNDDIESFRNLTPPGIHDEFYNLRKVLIQESKTFFKKMLNEMTHIEDLKVGDFIKFVKSIYETEASIKLDGTAALAFGFNDDGEFYTGFGRNFKTLKPEAKKYNEEEWLERKNIYINPAVSAHTFFTKHLDVIKKHMKPGDVSLAEILFGDKPNCIKYDFSGMNYIVILNNPELAEELNGINGEINTVNYVLDTDGITPKAVKQKWKFGKTQRVDPAKYNIDINGELKELEDFLNKENNGIRNIDIISMRAIGKNKELIKKVREDAKSLKLNIKEKLLSQFVRQVKEGEYSPAEGYSHEGVVLKSKSGEMIKIIDKEVFTAIHDRDWEPRHAVKKIAKTLPPKEAIKEIDKMIDNFDSLYPNIASDMKVRAKNSLRMMKITLKDRL